jgi:hypothetical protein
LSDSASLVLKPSTTESSWRKHGGSFWIGVNVSHTALHVRGAEAVRWYQSSEKALRQSELIIHLSQKTPAFLGLATSSPGMRPGP